MKRVGIVMPLAEQRGGGELMLLHLLQQGRDKGIAWQVAFLENGPMVTQVRVLGVPVQVFEAGRVRNVPRYLRTVTQLAQSFRRDGARLALGWMGTGHLYSGVAARLAGIPACWYQLGIPLDKGLFDRLAARLPAVGILACSQAGAAAQAALTPHIPLRVVYPGVELDRFDPQSLPAPVEARRKLGLPDSGPLIGMVGRLQRWKGMHVLVEAMATVRAKYSDATVVIVGGQHPFEPDYLPFLQRLIRERGLQDVVRLVGLQPNVQEWMQAMDVFVHASDNEPFGIVIIEAMALGKPVIASNTAGPLEIIIPEQNGLLTPYGDGEALAAALVRCLSDSELRQRLQANAPRRAAEFSTARYASNLIAACQEIGCVADEGGWTGASWRTRRKSGMNPSGQAQEKNP